MSGDNNKLNEDELVVEELLFCVKDMTRDETADFFGKNIEIFTMLLRGTVGDIPTADFLRRTAQSKKRITPDHLHQKEI